MNDVQLYGIDSKGRIKLWKAYTTYIPNTDDHIEVIAVWGLQEGKAQTKVTLIKAGKNLNRANATTKVQQADIKLNTMYNEQLDSGYVQDINDLYDQDKIEAALRPTLAHTWNDKKHLYGLDLRGMFVKSLVGQYKLNGVRCFAKKVAEDKIEYKSRSGQVFKDFPHITRLLLPVMELHDLLDGELYTHGVPLEAIVSTITGQDDRDVSILQYHVYDSIQARYLQTLDVYTTNGCNYLNRFLIGFTISDNPYVFKVQTVDLPDYESIIEMHSDAVRDGYEGIMIRDLLSEYQFNQRSSNLLKYKIMLTDEFLIKDVYLAENDSSKVQIVVENHLKGDGSTFELSSVLGDRLVSKELYYHNKDSVIGRYITVDYQALSVHGVPVFGVGVCLREGTVASDGRFLPSI